MYQTLQYECADGIATVRFNRPNKLNAINPEMIDDLRKLAADIRADLQRLKRDTESGRAIAHSSGSVPAAPRKMRVIRVCSLSYRVSAGACWPSRSASGPPPAFGRTYPSSGAGRRGDHGSPRLTIDPAPDPDRCDPCVHTGPPAPPVPLSTRAILELST